MVVRRRLDPANPPRFTPEQLARLDAMSPEEIEENARTDPDNPPSTEDELRRGVVARELRMARERSGLSAAEFAAKHGVDPARLLEWERGRVDPEEPALARLLAAEGRAEPDRTLAGRAA